MKITHYYKSNKMYDENLNDLQPQVIKILIRTLIVLGIITICSIIITAVVFVTDFKHEKVIKSQNTLIQQQRKVIEKEDYLLSLETNIGYYLTLPYSLNTECNDSVLYEFLVMNNVWFPEIVLRQAKLESANYTSNIYNTCNNLFGMKQCFKRQTTQTDVKKGYGYYCNWQLSVLDRILWDLNMFEEKPDEAAYFKALKNYAEDSSYITKLLSIK